jgi:peroxiredoxin
LCKIWTFGWSFPINPDGTFRIDDVPAGPYTMFAEYRLYDPDTNFISGVARSNNPVLVADEKIAQGAPVALGNLPLEMTQKLLTGDVATDFEFRSIASGKSSRVSDYHGQYLMLVFWRTESGYKQSVDEFRKYFGKFETDPRLHMVWLASDNEEQVPEAAKEFGITGDVAFAEQSTIPVEYEFCPVTACLIDPQGKLVKKFLAGDKAAKYVTKYFDTKK